MPRRRTDRPVEQLRSTSWTSTADLEETMAAMFQHHDAQKAVSQPPAPTVGIALPPTVGAQPEPTVGSGILQGIDNTPVTESPTVGCGPTPTVGVSPAQMGISAPTVGDGTQPTVERNPAPTVGDDVKPTVGPASTPTVGSAYMQPPSEAAPTVGFSPRPTVGLGLWLSEDGTKVFSASRTKPITQAQDAMTAHEERVYNHLRRRGSGLDGTESRTIRAGYGRLSLELKMDRQNVKHILLRLQDKGVIRELEAGRADDRSPTLYEVYGYSDILQHLRARGRRHIVKSGNGVLFVYPGGDPSRPTVGVTPTPTVGLGLPPTVGANTQPTVGSAPTAPVGTGPRPTVGAAPTPLGTSAEGIPERKLVSSIVVGVREFFLLDDGAVKTALAQAEPGLKIHEALHFARMAALKLARQKNVYNHTALWIKQFAGWASGTALEMYREEAARERENQLEHLDRKVWQTIIENPEAPEDQKRLAMRVLDL